MRRVHRYAVVPYGAAQMYALVNDVAAYSEFLPWCRRSRVLEVSPGHMVAELEMAMGALSRTLTTRNTLTPDERIQIQLVSGPLRRLDGDWHFRSLDPQGCRVDAELEFQVSGGFLDFAWLPAFERVCNTLVDSFVRRAEQVYGRG